MNKLSLSEIKHIRSLSQKKFRDEYGMFVVEGEKMVQEAIDSGFVPVRIYKREEIGQEQMERISSLDSPSPVLAVLKMAARQSEVNIKEKGLYLALDSIRDPGNLGTIMRICDWFGVDGIFASPDTVDQYNPKVVQSSMGAIFRKTVHYCDLGTLCSRFIDGGLPVYGTFLDGKDLYSSVQKPYGLIVMGNESRGVSPQVRALCTDPLLIPSFERGPHAESLNVAVATAVTVSEFKRKSTYDEI